jgi:hypothetical protein
MARLGSICRIRTALGSWGRRGLGEQSALIVVSSFVRCQLILECLAGLRMLNCRRSHIQRSYCHDPSTCHNNSHSTPSAKTTMLLSDGISSTFPDTRLMFARKSRSVRTVREVENPSSRASPCLETFGIGHFHHRLVNLLLLPLQEVSIIITAPAFSLCFLMACQARGRSVVSSLFAQ